MNKQDCVAVTSRSFSKNVFLREELLAKYANVKFNDDGLTLEGKHLIEFLKDCQKAIIALERIDETVLAQLPHLKVISKQGVGIDNIDLKAAERYGIKVRWKPGTNKRAVAELALGLILSTLRHIHSVYRELLAGKWRQQIGTQLTGKNIGIIGLGHIGRDLCAILKPFQCRIMAYDILPADEFYVQHNIQSSSLDDLLLNSDIVSLHLPLLKETKNILTHEKLKLMKPNAVLVNTARGGLVDEQALKEALTEKRIAAAAFDVFNEEPVKDEELLLLPNFLATSHISGSTTEAILAMGRAAIEGLDNNS